MTADNLDAQVARLQVQVDSHEQRITAHGLKIDSLNESVIQYHARTDERLNSIDGKLDSIGETVGGIDQRLVNEEQQPAENWKALTKRIAAYALGGVAAILGGIVCIVLAQAGLAIL